MLAENKEMFVELEKQVREKLGIPASEAKSNGNGKDNGAEEAAAATNGSSRKSAKA
jgi:hypothetical protein